MGLNSMVVKDESVRTLLLDELAKVLSHSTILSVNSPSTVVDSISVVYHLGV